MSANIKTWERLRAAAKGCDGWSWPDRRRDENGTHHFGQLRDGEFYDLGTIDAWTYTSDYADDLRILKFIRAAQPETILQLLDEIDALNASLKNWADKTEWIQTLCSAGTLPFAQPGMHRADAISELFRYFYTTVSEPADKNEQQDNAPNEGEVA